MSNNRARGSTSSANVEHWLANGGAMGALIATKDWTITALGPIEQWPTVLTSTLGTCLTARFPMAIYWGAERFLLYNDAWKPILGDKHPWGMGRPAQEVWPEIWDSIHPLFETVWTTGKATWRGDALLLMQRFGYTEECYFDYTFNPIRGESGNVEGILNVVQETTYRVLNDRRSRLMREIAFRSGSAKSEKEACEKVISAIATDTTDIPFAIMYLLKPDQQCAHLVDATGLPNDNPALVSVVDLAAETDRETWPFVAALQKGKPTIVDDLSKRFGVLPGGSWPEPTMQALVLPIAVAGQEGIMAMLVVGVNPRRQLDEDYAHFFETVTSHVAIAITGAKAYSLEKRRAEALAELDRTKTAFFSNVSHEFRTPLTLMLGPVEDLLVRSRADLPPSAASQLELVNRNGLRLLRLVNTLLDFSRIEAGRVQAVFEPTDLAAFTAELASTFRSATEQAGLRLVVDCPPLPEPVFVDREMWEKIVLNLISNAVKFTFEGEIEVSLRESNAQSPSSLSTQNSTLSTESRCVQLRVRDTGVGIPPEEMPRLFERFHRIENMRSRTHEGSGIGLALVQELVKLHGGAVRAESNLGEGTIFIVTVSLGRKHLPNDRIRMDRSHVRTAKGADSFVDEALRWLPAEDGSAEVKVLSSEFDSTRLSTGSAVRDPQDSHPRILVADDNADMRHYIVRLLAERYRVEAVADGEAALVAVRKDRPDLILTDVMMPRLDGFGLLRELRDDAATKTIPIILLSARAGEESKVEGLEHGADDYLIKPFSARELTARVASHLEMTRIRREAQSEIARSKLFLERMAAATPDMLFVHDLIEGRNVYMNRSLESVLGYTVETFQSMPGDLVDTLVHPDDLAGIRQWLARFDTLADGEIIEHEHRVRHADGSYRWIFARAAVFERTPEGTAKQIIGVVVDITERKRTEEASLRLAAIVESSADAIISKDFGGVIMSWNKGAELIFGYTAAEAVGQNISMLFPPDRLDEETEINAKIKKRGACCAL
ncbi:MAG: PAS domain S-box protein [Nitrospiraceae bacterium]|nr:PAS domain S-box protein [Nitrospiraceae bacterium]